MQLKLCSDCKKCGTMCNFLLLDAYASVKNIEYLTNKAISYSRQQDKKKIKFDFECDGFELKDILK